MRSAQLLIVLIISLAPTAVRATSVEIYAPRPFGYFVGDLIRAQVDIRADPGAILQTASLPRPGPLTASLNLRGVEVDESRVGAGQIWRLRITYQNFYVPLDARQIDIPGFPVMFSGAAGPETVNVPGWRVGVSPIREIQPPQQNDPLDYMRPDGPAPSVEERSAGGLAIGLGALTFAGLIAVARDRAWPPFHTRRARLFTGLARRIGAAAQKPYSDDAYREALLALHRGIDSAAGRSILAEDLPEFLRARPEFSQLASSFERFFTASRAAFFGASGALGPNGFGMAEVADFARRLATQERLAS